MKIQYKFVAKDLISMGHELDAIVEMVKKNCVAFGGVVSESLQWTKGQATIEQATIDIIATLSPKHINAALENQGYIENGAVGVNNDNNTVLFDDDINGMYLISKLFLFIEGNKICAEFCCQSDGTNEFHTFQGF